MSFGGFGSTGSGFSFGNFSAPATTSATSAPFAFGNTQTQTQSSPFGTTSTTSTAPAFSSFGGFGSTATAPNATAPFSFGTAGQPAFGTAASSSPFPSTSFGQSQQQQQQQQQQPLSSPALPLLEAQILELKAAYDPTSQLCKFQTVFYNKVDPAKLSTYKQPPSANPALWQRAVKNNPNPAALTPTLAVGFSDLQKRLDAQAAAHDVYGQTIEALQRATNSMIDAHKSITEPSIETIADTQHRLASRLLRVINKVDMQLSQGLPLTPDELQFRRKLESLAINLQRVGSASDRARELEVRARAVASQGITLAASGDTELNLSEEEKAKLKSIVESQTRALEYLLSVAKQDKQQLKQLHDQQPKPRAWQLMLQ